MWNNVKPYNIEATKGWLIIDLFKEKWQNSDEEVLL